MIVSLGALLGRQFYFEHGHFTIYPNMYAMLIGTPGVRKSTAIKTARKLLTTSGYTTIAAEKTTKEKFLLDLAGESDQKFQSPEQLLDSNLFGDNDDVDAEMFVMADEFNDFFGNGNLEFISMLGTLWDFNGIYRNRIKNGKSVNITNPTISILGGNTPTGLSSAFPPEVFGQGFFSRLLLIYGEPNGKRIAFPPAPDPNFTSQLVEQLRAIKTSLHGVAELTNSGRQLLEKIYHSTRTIDDVRFESFSTRRFTHLLKLCLVIAATRGTKRVDDRTVIEANTILSYAEHFMPKALGEFGKAKHSDVSHKILTLIESATGPVNFKDIWRHVNQDLEKVADLGTLLSNLAQADKIQAVPGMGSCFLPKKKLLAEEDTSVIDWSILTSEERRMKL